MRRLLLASIIFLLGTSGWSAVLAASLCPHLQREHACCVKKRTHECGQEVQEQKADPDAASERSPSGAVLSLEQPPLYCGHCLGRPDAPAPVNLKRVTGAADENSDKAPAQYSGLSAPVINVFTLFTFYREGTPPGNSTPRYVLISQFLI